MAANDERAVIDEAMRAWARAADSFAHPVLTVDSDRAAWRTYAAAALQGMLAARLVAPDPLYGGSALRQAAEIADGMLALERARFGEGGGGGDAPR